MALGASDGSEAPLSQAGFHQAGRRARASVEKSGAQRPDEGDVRFGIKHGQLTGKFLRAPAVVLVEAGDHLAGYRADSEVPRASLTHPVGPNHAGAELAKQRCAPIGRTVIDSHDVIGKNAVLGISASGTA